VVSRAGSTAPRGRSTFACCPAAFRATGTVLAWTPVVSTLAASLATIASTLSARPVVAAAAARLQ
jgi:hypothetical protein